MAAQPDLESDALVASDVKNETRAPVKKVDRVKRPEKPDRTQLDAQVEQLQTQIDQCQSRIQQIKALIEQKKDSRRHVGSEGSGPRSRLAELRQTFKVNVVSFAIAFTYLLYQQRLSLAPPSRTKAFHANMYICNVPNENLYRVNHTSVHGNGMKISTLTRSLQNGWTYTPAVLTTKYFT